MSNKKNLTEKEHWDSIYKKDFGPANYLSNSIFSRSYYHYALFKIASRFLQEKHKNVIEIGCAPGNYLVKFKKILKLNPFGIEYSKDGYEKTLENVSFYRISRNNIFFEDFFNPIFLEKNKSNYDVVFSAGFIEHFNNPKEVIEKQIEMIKTGGILICIIPNKKYINSFLTSRESLAIHNLSIMDKEIFYEIFNNKKLEIKYCDYFGGIINMGLYQPKGIFVKSLVFLLFIIQKLFIDNFWKIMFFCTKKDFTTKYTSPSLLCIAKKISQ